MLDRPSAATASYAVLYTGYASPGVAATVGYLQDGDRRVVTDPGMVPHPSVILNPLGELGVAPEQVTDVVFSHHHPDHTLNAALFPTAHFHDHWAIYHRDQWALARRRRLPADPGDQAHPDPRPHPGGHHHPSRDPAGRGRLHPPME